MDVTTILYIVSAVAGFIAAAIPTVIALVRSIKKKNAINKQLEATTDETTRAKLEAEKAQAELDMMNTCQSLIENAETLYENVATVLKSNGQSAAVVKKDSVMSKLQAYALTNGYEFDEAYWSDKIDNMVAFTKAVNNKSTT